jgi:tRNA 2-thiouridine synthesizing protein A
VPTLRLRKAIETGGPGLYRLLSTDPMARIDAPHLVAALGGRVVSVEEAADGLAITVAWRDAGTG